MAARNRGHRPALGQHRRHRPADRPHGPHPRAIARPTSARRPATPRRAPAPRRGPSRKADTLDPNLSSETQLQEHLGLNARPSELLPRLAKDHRVLLILDQLDALAGYLDLRTERLSILLGMVRRMGRVDNIHIVLSSRPFEFKHDLGLQAVSAQSLSLELHAWNAVLPVLEARGIHAAGWPERGQELMRTPQALKTYLSLSGPDRPEAFSTYQEMLDHLWDERIVAREGGPGRGQFARQVAEQMAYEETLWLPRRVPAAGSLAIPLSRPALRSLFNSLPSKALNCERTVQ